MPRTQVNVRCPDHVAGVLRDVAARLRSRIEALERGGAGPNVDTPATSYKTASGYLNAAGESRLLALLRDGTTDAEAARQLDVRPGAVHHRRAKWRRSGDL